MIWQSSRWRYLLKWLLRMRYVCVDFGGGERGKETYSRFSARHPRYLVIPNKSLGVALLELRSDFQGYLKANSQLKRKRNKALKLGYTVTQINPLDFLDDILAVNSSMHERQGRAIEPDYLDRDSLERHYSKESLVLAAFKHGTVVGYIDLPVFGDVCILSRILGHADHLENGVMYLLVSEVVQRMITRREEHGGPRWVMYDTMFGASPGLRFFKEQCGFAPFFVKWRWNEKLA